MCRRRVCTTVVNADGVSQTTPVAAREVASTVTTSVSRLDVSGTEIGSFLTQLLITHKWILLTG